ncbi:MULTISPECIES: lipopolysaccharide biosynthesis protein [Enterobacteriaceae]|uniref:lipopolysaccharide biosynthesis protein n=1 Tax=Enterobacteriaceae TaxID=543 RepID=UPI00092A3B44|nr:hypothetical protein [Escherichia coli]EFE7783041.1 hypothetical protein [Escherichia coli]EJE0231372.1 hypothetical protein [Escherichia coli]EJF1601623.1 hypothetical protein [Escherichia coli]MBY7340899.1 hypothetical protein [Escherichia coli]MBY7464680.1 hypothetical protein [Escherichia coli]
MRTKKALKNIKTDLLITVLILILGFITRTVFIQHMGGDMTGLMLLFTQLISYLNLAELGIGVAAASILYTPLAEGDEYKTARIYYALKRIYIYVAGIVIVLGSMVSIFLFLYVDSVRIIPHAFWYWAMFVINTALTYGYAANSTYLIADQNYADARKIQGGGRILSITLQIVCISTTSNFFFYLLIDSVLNILLIIFFNIKVKKVYAHLNVNKYNPSGLNDSKEIKKTLYRKIKQISFHKIGGVLVTGTDYIIISKYLNLISVTIYASYMMVFQVVTLCVSVLSNSLTAGVGNYLKSKSTEQFYELCRSLYMLFGMLLSIVIPCFYFLIDDFIINWIGREYIVPETVLCLMLFNVFVSIFRVPCDIIKNASGFFGDIHLPIIEGVINLVASLILAKFFGLAGVIIGTIISNIIVILILRPLYLFGKLFGAANNSLRILSMLYSGPILFSVLSISLSFIVVNVFSLNYEVHGWTEWMLKTLFIAFIISVITMMCFIINKTHRDFLVKLSNTLYRSKINFPRGMK